jgi:hypothetical protein
MEPSEITVRHTVRNLALTSPRPIWAWRACNPVARWGKERHASLAVEAVIATTLPETLAQLRYIVTPDLAHFMLQKMYRDRLATTATDDTEEKQKEGSIRAPWSAALCRPRGRTSFGSLEDDAVMDELMMILPPWEGLRTTEEEISEGPVVWHPADSLNMSFVTGLFTPLHIQEPRPLQLRLELNDMPRLAAATAKGIGRT